MYLLDVLGLFVFHSKQIRSWYLIAVVKGIYLALFSL